MSLSVAPSPLADSNALLHGRDDSRNLVGFEIEGLDRIRVFTREHTGVEAHTVPFEPWLLLSDESALKGWQGDCRLESLTGHAKFRWLVRFPDFGAQDSAKTHLQKRSGKRLSASGTSYLYFTDPIQQYLLMTGRTHFHGMSFGSLMRMQIDLETYCGAGFEFPNAARKSDRITAIAMSDTTGWERLISGREFDEPEMLAEMVGEIRRRDPDVLEGHNFFRFDLNYLRVRAQRYGQELKLGRNDGVLGGRSARVEFGDRRVTFVNFQIFGRHVIDTWFLAQAYDLRTRELPGHGLKAVARHFGVAAPGRTYIPGEKASWYFDHEPDTLFRYALDDVRETRAISALLSPTYFLQAQIFPCSYQQVALQEDLTKVDGLLLRAYLAEGHSIPAPLDEDAHALELTNHGSPGLVQNVSHCAVTSLHSSIMLSKGYFPRSDQLGVVSKLLRELVRRQVYEQTLADQAQVNPSIEDRMSAVTYEILMSSVPSYLGFTMGHFHDPEAARQVKAEAGAIMASLAQWLEQHGARVIEVEAEGVYFVALPLAEGMGIDSMLRREWGAVLPAGSTVHVDGPYPAMFSYDGANHALLDEQGRTRIKGPVLYPRGLEPFLRQCLDEMLRLFLEGKKDAIPALHERYREALQMHRLDIALLMKTETLQESLEDYQIRVKGARRNPRGVYEIALRSGRDYLAGDQVSYYVTGEGAHVKVNEHCKHISEWNPDRPDENVEYYKAKLRALYQKFQPFVAEKP